MSGSTGTQRIKKEDVQKTIDHYIKNILGKYPNWTGKYAITGSYVVGKKSDYGDIDIVILVKGSNMASAKKDFINWLTKNYEDKPELLMPFESQKYKGKLYLNTGEIVVIHYPQFGKDYGCQIDNMFALNEEDFYFKQNYLNIPAEKQGLISGLVKIATLENDVSLLFNKLGINKNVNLPEGFEWEFNISGTKLELRKVELDENYKQLSKTVEWTSSNWSDISKLLYNYDLNLDFDSLLKTVKTNLKNKRSGNRIIVAFKSMISIGSGEVGTEKAMNKLRAIAAIENTFNENKNYIKTFKEYFNI